MVVCGGGNTGLLLCEQRGLVSGRRPAVAMGVGWGGGRDGVEVDAVVVVLGGVCCLVVVVAAVAAAANRTARAVGLVMAVAVVEIGQW